MPAFTDKGEIEGEGRNVLDIMKWYLLSACTKRNPHVAVLKTYGKERGMNVAQLRPVLLSGCLVPKVTNVLRFDALRFGS